MRGRLKGALNDIYELFCETAGDTAGFVPIAICRYPPKWYRGLTYKALAPPTPLLNAWNGGAITAKGYIRVYESEVLNNLNPDVVVGELTKLADGHDIVLLCYEKTGDFCHRQLVADWLNRAGYDCSEFGI